MQHTVEIYHALIVEQQAREAKLRGFCDYAWREIPMNAYADEMLREVMELPTDATTLRERLAAERERAAQVCLEVGEDGPVHRRVR